MTYLVRRYLAIWRYGSPRKAPCESGQSIPQCVGREIASLATVLVRFAAAVRRAWWWAGVLAGGARRWHTGRRWRWQGGTLLIANADLVGSL